MATEAKNNKNLIIGICGAVVAIAIIVVVAVFVLKNKKPTLNDDYFKSDGSKLVISMDADASQENAAVKQHQVYTYSGETITGLKSYLEFETADAAKAAYDSYKNTGEDGSISKVELDGKYIVMTIAEEQYKELTTTAVKGYIELFESIKNAALEETSGDTETTVEDPEAETEDEE